MEKLDVILKKMMGRNSRTFYSRMSAINKISLASLGFMMGKILYGTVLMKHLAFYLLIIASLFMVFALSNSLTFTAIKSIADDAKKNGDKEQQGTKTSSK